MKSVASFIAILTLSVSLHAAVVRNAPDFSWPGAGSSGRSLKSLRGQAVVLVIADSPKTGAFRKQLDWLQLTYTALAGKQVVFIAAFKQGEGPVKSDIPFVVANNGAAVASAYGAIFWSLPWAGVLRLGLEQPHAKKIINSAVAVRISPPALFFPAQGLGFEEGHL